MPSTRAQATPIIHRVPIVQAAILPQGLRFVASIDLRLFSEQVLLPSPYYAEKPIVADSQPSSVTEGITSPFR